MKVPEHSEIEWIYNSLIVLESLSQSSLCPNFYAFHNCAVYNKRSAANQSYYLPRARTNYGIFNIRFQGPKVWNSLGKDIKSTPFLKLKKKIKMNCRANINVILVSVFPRVMSFFPVYFVIQICCLKFDFLFIIFRILS